MTSEAKLVAFFDEQKFIRRLVRRVATRALAVFHRLMFHLVARDEVLVAGKAKF